MIELNVTDTGGKERRITVRGSGRKILANVSDFRYESSDASTILCFIQNLVKTGLAKVLTYNNKPISKVKFLSL